MAKPKDDQTPTTVTRVKAKDDRKVEAKQSKTSPLGKAAISGDSGEPKKNIFKRFIGYFTGAWFELRQVRWPNRRSTWGMTAALLLFTLFFIVLILATDIVWEYLFKLILE